MVFKNRKFVALLIALILIASVVPTAKADTSGIVHPAINDKVEELGYMPVFMSGTAYVSAKLFSSNGLLHSDFFTSNNTALLYNDSNKQVFFEMETGKTYDNNGAVYQVSAVFYGSQVYVPLSWVCGYFGFGYSYISGDGNGDIARITTGAQALSDARFLDAASELMKKRNEQYFGKPEPTPSSPPPTPVASEEPTNFAKVSLCFTGLPSKALLDTFDSFKYKASFFLTADEITSDPDMVRRISGSGHSLGIYVAADPKAEVPDAADALFIAAQIRPTLLYSQATVAADAKSYAKSNGMAYFTPMFIAPSGTSASGITAQIELAQVRFSISITRSDAIDKQIYSVLSYIASNKITVVPLRETTA